MINKIKQTLSLPSAWRTAPKVSGWVDDINSIPLKIVIEAQADGSVELWWDITMIYADGCTDKMKLKHKKRGGYIAYEPMDRVFKCILKNWKER